MPSRKSITDNPPIIEELDDSSDEEQDIEKLYKVISSIPKGNREYNILLLGETGAGKSTTVNAFANYLKHFTFEEAVANDFLEIIPSKFTLPDPTTGEPIVITSGSDKNERHGDGNSSTQDPVCYKFKFNGGLIRLIDTPGMGDTTGVDADKLNFDKILAHLNHYKTLHGICILMKSTETRKTASFRYCINELLTHLHKSASRNIVFCFTFSRNSFYGPGEGFSTLRGFLDTELKDVKLPLKTGENCFFIDNEAYRFLVAKKQNYPFKPKQEKSYKESWDTSVNQTVYMLLRMMNSTPHKLNETCSLNRARKMILEMAEPIVQLQANISANIAHIKNEEKRIKQSNATIQDLARNLYLDVDDVEFKELPYPGTVCTTAKCTEVINFEGHQKVNYKQRCHPHCSLVGVTVNTIGHPKLKDCWAMQGQITCHQCGCAWDLHMHLTCETVKVKRAIIDKNMQKQIKTAEDAKKVIEAGVKTMQQLVKEYEEEFEVIHDISSKFAYILIENSNTPYNRFIEPYLNLLIDEEEKKMAAIDNYPRTAYDSLVKMKQTHQENVRILTEAIDNMSRERVRLEDIELFRDELLDLKHSGPQFRQMLDVTMSAQQSIFKHMERPVIDFTKPKRPSLPNTTDNNLRSIKGSGDSEPLKAIESSPVLVVERKVKKASWSKLMKGGKGRKMIVKRKK